MTRNIRLSKGRAGQRGDPHAVESAKKSDPDRSNRGGGGGGGGQERSRIEAYSHQLDHSKAIMNMKQEGPFLGKKKFNCVCKK